MNKGIVVLATALVAFAGAASEAEDTRGVVVDSSAASAFVFDADTDRLVDSVTLGVPGQVALNDCSITADQSLAFVSDFSGRQVFVIDLSGPSLATGTNPIPVSVRASDTTITADQRFLLVSGDVSTVAPSGISVVDIAGRAEVGLLEGHFLSVEAGPDGSVLATDLLNGTVSRLVIDDAGNLTDTGERVRLFGAFDTAFPPGGRAGLVISNNLSSSVVQSLGYPPLAALSTRSLGAIGISIAVDPSGARVFTRDALFSGSSVKGFTYDPATGALGESPFLTFPAAFAGSFLGVEQLAIHPDGDKLYVPQQGSLKVHDAASGDLLASISGLIGPRGICVRPAEIEISNQPPLADAGADEVIDCTSSQGALVTLDGSGSSDPDSTPGTNDDIDLFEWFEDFGQPTQTFLGEGETIEVTLWLGERRITLRVTDGFGDTDVDEVVKTVVDTVPPEISLSLDPDTLWPPNHRMVPVQAAVVATDQCGTPSVVLTSVISSEPDDETGAGDGRTTDDIQGADTGTPDFAYELRAERAGTGNGRTYTVQYTATDSAGNVASSSDFVRVPHDRNGNTEPVTLSVGENDNGTEVSWTAVDGASHYNVIRGHLSNIRETGSSFDIGAAVCIEVESLDETTQGWEDPADPVAGGVFFYLVEYDDGSRSSYGTESAAKPRVVSSGDCR